MNKIKLAIMFALLTCFAGSAAANDEAVVNTMKMRGWMQRNINNIFQLYGNNINAPKSCYEAAASNYINDLWTELAKSYGCANDEALCNKDPKAMEDFAKHIQDTGGDISNPQNRKAAFRTQNIWYIASQSFVRLRKLHYGLDPSDEANAFSAQRLRAADIEQKAQPITLQEKQQYMNELNKYVSGCRAVKPVAWTVPGNALPDDDLITSVSAKVSQEALLIGYMVAPQLPAEDRGYLGCIYTWNEAERSRDMCKNKNCADNVPADDNAALKVKLDQLKANNCDLTAALGMLPESAEAQPVGPK